MTVTDTSVTASFSDFYESTSPRMLAKALVLTCNRSDAEDAVQEGYTKALETWDRVGTYEAPDAWVYRVVRQQLWKAAGRWSRTGSLEAMELAAWASTSDTELAVELRLALDAISALTDKRRNVLVMSLQGMSHQEIAEELGLRDNAVRQRIFKARQALERMVGNSAPDLAYIPVPSHNLAGTGELPDLLLATETWLCNAIASNERVRIRIYRAVLAKASRRLK